MGEKINVCTLPTIFDPNSFLFYSNFSSHRYGILATERTVSCSHCLVYSKQNFLYVSEVPILPLGSNPTRQLGLLASEVLPYAWFEQSQGQRHLRGLSPCEQLLEHQAQEQGRQTSGRAFV